MTDESKLQQAATKGQRAKQLLEDPLFVEAFDTLEKQLIEAWISSHPRDAIGRENAHRMIHAHRKVKDLLLNCMANGRVAEADIRAALRLKAA